MAIAARVRLRLVHVGWSLSTLAVLLAVPLAAPAAAQSAPEPDASPPACVVTGYAVPPGEDPAAAREELRRAGVWRLAGVDLTREDWVLPAGAQPVLIVDSTEPLERASLRASVAGQEFELWSGELAEGERRYVSAVSLSHLGSTTRTAGLVVRAGPCSATPVVSVDRSVWSTRVGQVGVGLTAGCGALLVVFARGRRGGGLRRFLLALPFGLLAAAGQAAVLHEAGRVDPFGAPPWWPPVLGLALAAVLPLTRPRRGPAGPLVGAVAAGAPPPMGSVVAGYQLEAPLARTQVATLFRAGRVPPIPSQPTPGHGPAAGLVPPRALVKVALPERAGEPLTRMRLEREAAVLAGLDHPNVIRLRETVRSAGPPLLIFDDVDGQSLRAVLTAGGTLSGPQVVAVVLEVLSGLSELHRRGLVHRDVRPETVFLDRAGRIRLTNFELVCVGMEHPAAPDGAPPYASPEQLAGEVLDERSDLWACGVILAELLTGRVPDGGQLPRLPPPLAHVLTRVLAPDPAGRPESAEQFAAQLREAAVQLWGPDWGGRAALAGAVVAHGAIGSMTAGYATAGSLQATGAGGVTPTGTAGLGTAGAGGAGGLGATGLGPAGGTLAGGGFAVAGQTAAGGGQGALSAVVSAAAAAVVVAGVGLTVALVDPDPVQARTEVIGPNQAQIIFVETVTEAVGGVDVHLADVVSDLFEQMLEAAEGRDGATLSQVVVGVPRDQYGYPAWFVGSGQLTFDDDVISIFARFERQTGDEPWLMVGFNWAEADGLPAPALDEEGWLAPAPEPLVQPETLPKHYLDWLRRVASSGELGEDDLLVLRYDFGTLHGFAENQLFDGDLDRVSFEYEMHAGEVVTDLVPLADGTVHVSFTAVIHQVMYNTPHRRTGSCVETYLFWTNGEPPGHFQHMEHDFVVTVEAWVPAEGAGVDPGDATVIIEDWNRRSENRESTPC